MRINEQNLKARNIKRTHVMVRSHQAKANAKANTMSLSFLLEWLCNPFKRNRFRLV